MGQGQLEPMRGAGGSSNGEHGMLASARDVVQNIGGATAHTARRFASGAKNAATGVARGTQETVSQAVDTVRDHPWPSLLIGAGVTWLAVDAIRGRSPQPGGKRRGRRQGSKSSPGVVSRTASTIADAGRGAGEYVGDFVRDRPLLAGAATLGLGMAVGMAMPSTSAENSVMGSARDSVVRRAKDVARGTMDAVRDVADSVERMASGSGGRERMR